MEIQIDPHTLERAEERGTNEDEIKDVVNTGSPIPARYGRMGKAKVYDFKRKRHGKHYEQKRVEVIYTIMENGREKMQILYNAKTDLLYIRLDDRKQPVINKRLSEDIVLDVGEGDRIVGIEILDASKRLNLERLLPVKYEIPIETA